MIKIYTNIEILQMASELQKLHLEQQYLPVKISFFLHKNIQTIQQSAMEIEQARFRIAEEYGVFNAEQNIYSFSQENAPAAQKELSDLCDIRQELDIYNFKLSDFEDIELTYEQFEAISFMIEE